MVSVIDYPLPRKTVIIRQMGFQTWTLWGMGLAALGALVAIGLALIAQSPRFIKQTGLGVYHLEARARLFTGYGFALILLAMGFFLAGVPLDSPPVTEEEVGDLSATTAVTEVAAESEESDMALTITAEAVLTTPDISLTTSTTPVTGAFSGPPVPAETATPELESSGAPSSENSPTPSPTATQTAVSTPVATATTTPSPTSTTTPTPTVTPTPTLTPTPIEGRTAVVNTGGNTLWLRRVPGGQNLVLLQNQETVLVLSGRANQGGILWQEISTLQGVAGWVQAEFLQLDE